jgi:hypothetical protein
MPTGSCELSNCETLDETIALAKRRGISTVTVIEDGAQEREVSL